MIGSDGIAALVAHVAFWTILGLGIAFGEIGRKVTSIFLCVWVIGVFALPRISPAFDVFVAPSVAVLDIALALVVFKGDVRLS